MVLKHVPQHAGLFVVTGAVLHAQLLGGGDLDVIDVAAVPHGLEQHIGEPEHQNVLDGLFGQVMIDAVNLVFMEDFANFPVERLGRGKRITERFFNDHPRPS